MKPIFVTGTDTGVGKTVVTGLLGRYFLEKGHRVITQKWIQSGRTGSHNDIDVHLKLMKKKRSDVREHLSLMEPYSFKFPSSPHLASRLENKKIDLNKIKRTFYSLKRGFDFVIVEGVGGALVPLHGSRLLIDIVKDLHLPVLVVVGNKLGAINHTLLTIEAIRRREMNILGLVFNNLDKGVDNLILKDNVRIIKEISGERVLGTLPKLRNMTLLYKKFSSIGDNILNI